jgi:hypothetical protein
MSLGFPTRLSEQTRTAARPSRILTVFPFDYPEAWLQDLQSGYIVFKEQSADFYYTASRPSSKNQKKFSLP